MCPVPGEVGAVFMPTNPEEWFDTAPGAMRVRVALHTVDTSSFALPEGITDVEAGIAGNGRVGAGPHDGFTVSRPCLGGGVTLASR